MVVDISILLGRASLGAQCPVSPRKCFFVLSYKHDAPDGSVL